MSGSGRYSFLCCRMIRVKFQLESIVRIVLMFGLAGITVAE
jgi:hypothetical protein